MKTTYIFPSLAMILGLSACSGTTPLDVTYTPAKMNIEQPADPAPVIMNSVNFHVVTKDNLQSFVASQIQIQGNQNPVFIVISTNDYKALSLNLAELKRYILQQQKIIVYYKSATTAAPTTK